MGWSLSKIDVDLESMRVLTYLYISTLRLMPTPRHLTHLMPNVSWNKTVS